MLFKERNVFLTTLFTIVVVFASNVYSLEYTSFVYNTHDLIFFSYDPCTVLEIYESDGSDVIGSGGLPVLINGGSPLNKGEHDRLVVNVDVQSDHVYLVTGSKKFSVLTGDAAIGSLNDQYVGYYAVDPNGLGVAKELYTYVPHMSNSAHNNEHCKFIVFGYEDDTNVTVQREVSGSYVDVESFSLNDGEHWESVDDPNLYNKYMHVSADKPVSALTCFDMGYFVPAANGTFRLLFS